MGFFDFTADMVPYSEDANGALRLNRRHAMLVAPFVDDLAAARVLDLGAHDGRWAYALAAAGATDVLGVEARANLIDRFSQFPDAPFKARVRLREGDLFDVLERMVRQDQRVDVVAVFGIFYHIMDHMRLLYLLRGLGARLVLVDSEFSLVSGASITLVMEDPDNDLNAVAQHAGQQRTLVGIPTFAAMEKMAQSAGYAITWDDAAARFGSDTTGVRDYFRTEKKRRAFCALRLLGDHPA